MTGLVCDVSDLGAFDDLYATITERSDRRDVLVANAGSGHPIGLVDITEEH